MNNWITWFTLLSAFWIVVLGFRVGTLEDKLQSLKFRLRLLESDHRELDMLLSRPTYSGPMYTTGMPVLGVTGDLSDGLLAQPLQEEPGAHGTADAVSNLTITSEDLNGPYVPPITLEKDADDGTGAA